mgnify:CR=1 FL=1
MEWVVEPPPEELYLLLDCSSNTLHELFDILKIIKYISDPEPEIIEVLNYIPLQELNKKHLKYIYENISWTNKIIHIGIEIEKLYYSKNKKIYPLSNKTPIIKYMKKPIKKFE